MRRFTIAVWIICAGGILWRPAQALAQAVANAAIHGVVSDPSGAFIPLAHIKATQTDTGQVLSTVTSSDGAYLLPNLPVGPYSVEATAQQQTPRWWRLKTPRFPKLWTSVASSICHSTGGRRPI